MANGLLTADFRAAFPEFADPTAWPDALIDARLQTAFLQINQAVFAEKFLDAQGYLTAHLLLMTSPGRSAGMSEVQAGSARVQYRQGFGRPTTSLEQTNYGLEFQRIKRMVGGPILAVIPPVMPPGGWGC